MRNVVKFAASSLVLAITTMGCTGSKHVRTAADYRSESPKGNRAERLQQQAQIALRKGDIAAAISAMEQAVATSPRDAGFRMGLAELYMRSGRFASAETTFADVLALNPGDSRAGFYLALTQIAQGKTTAALDQLGSMDSNVAPADIGLAYAIAGDTRRALELLEPAARAPNANGRVRQNLALAYALAGDWKKARVTAEQDVSPAEINKRMAQWASLADPSTNQTRVASLLGVKTVEDPGQPVRLALAPAAVPEATAFAEAAPVEEEMVEVAMAAAEPSVEPAPLSAETEAVYARAVQSLVEPQTVRQASFTSIAPTPIPAFATASRAKPSLEAPLSSASGRYVVQIGAYRSAAQVELAWDRVRHKLGLTNQSPQSTTIRIPGKGVFHRLSVAGFDDPAAARSLCRSIKARGGACFVRTTAGDAPLQWVARDKRDATQA